MKSTTFALFLGVTYLSVGLLGLMPGMLAPPPADAPPLHLTMLQGYLLGLLQSAVHLRHKVATGTEVPRLEDCGVASLLKLLETLEDSDDVQNVYANFDIPDSILDLVEA